VCLLYLEQRVAEQRGERSGVLVVEAAASAGLNGGACSSAGDARRSLARTSASASSSLGLEDLELGRRRSVRYLPAAVAVTPADGSERRPRHRVQRGCGGRGGEQSVASIVPLTWTSTWTVHGSALRAV
jgi:hypothetical protein